MEDVEEERWKSGKYGEFRAPRKSIHPHIAHCCYDTLARDAEESDIEYMVVCSFEVIDSDSRPYGGIYPEGCTSKVNTKSLEGLC